MLEALIERMMNEVELLLLPIVHDPKLAALDKFQHFFDTLNRYKTAQKPFLLELWRVWYTDDNALVRQKVRTTLVKRVKPLLTMIIRQGVQEGVLITPYPDQVGEVVLSLQQGLEETMAGLLFLDESKREDVQQIENTIAAYVSALERILGAPGGSLHPVDAEMLKEWVVSQRDNV